MTPSSDATPDDPAEGESSVPPQGEMGPGAAFPLVVADPVAARAAEARREARASLPAFGLAVLAHALLLWLAGFFEGNGVLPSEPRYLLVASVDPSARPEDTPPAPEPEVEPPEPLPEPVVQELPALDDPDDVPTGVADTIGLGAAGQEGRGGRSSTLAPSAESDALASGEGGDAFRGFVDDLRQRGLDVVFVLDATGSMQAFIDRARAAIDEIVADLSAVVPSLRLGLVAYRDLDDAWVTRTLDLTADRYRVHNFLLELEAAGGKRGLPDFEEAVEEGLRVAAAELSWRTGARRVLLLVGDAPYHDADQRAALRTVRDFAQQAHSQVNTFYVGTEPADRPTENQRRAREEFEKIARAGGGHAFELLSDDDLRGPALRSRVRDATFGSEWRDEVVALLERVPHDARAASVRRRVEQGDRAWLLHRLDDQPLHPAVPEALVELFDRSIALACLERLSAESLPATARSAALFVLKKGLPGARSVAYDVHQPVAEQTRALAILRRNAEEVPVAGPRAGANVAPPASPAPPVPPR